MDCEAMMRAGQARRTAKKAPEGGGYANGGRVGKAAYAQGGQVEKGSASEMPGPRPYKDADGRPSSHRTGGGYANGGRVGKAAHGGEADAEPPMRRGALKVEVESGGYARGGRVKGKGC